MASLPVNFPWCLGGDETQAAVVTQGASADTSRLAQYIKGKPNMEALLDALGQQASDAAMMMEQLRTDRLIANAFGSQLDVLAEIVGEAREGSSDELLRARIRAAILSLSSSGTTDELAMIAKALSLTQTHASTTQYFPHVVVVRVPETTTQIHGGIYTKMIRRARAAGVRSIVEWHTAATGDTLTFDSALDAQGLDAGTMADASE